MYQEYQLEQAVREGILTLCKSMKNDYVIVHEYLTNRIGKPKSVKEAYLRMNDRAFEAIAKYESATCESFVIFSKCPGSWERGEDVVYIDKHKLAERASKIAQCRSDRMKTALKNGMQELTVSISMILSRVEVDGCFQNYCLDDHKMELVDYEEMARLEEESRKKDEAKKHIRQLLDGRGCEELVAYLEENATKINFVIPDTQEEAYYYKFNDRLYDSNGNRFGYATVLKWNLVDEM